MPANGDGCRDELGEHDDWVELYNTGEVAVELGGYSLTNDTALPRLSVIPDGLTIAAHGILLFWADESTGQGASHLGFRLKASQGEVVLYDDQTREADRFDWRGAAADVSFARVPDGAGNWSTCRDFTCGSNNASGCGGST